MGFKLAGIAISADFSKNLMDLMRILEVKDFVLVKESTFEEENFRNFEDEYLSVAFLKMEVSCQQALN